MADEVSARVAVLLVELDSIIARSINTLLHHPVLQRLEALWRNLYFLIQQKGNAKNVKIRILDASWSEIGLDVSRAIEFDQSQLFQKIYTEEFGMPGGEPYGVIIGDYEVCVRTGPDTSGIQDIATLARLSEIGEAAFVPMIMNVAPLSFGLDDMTEFETLSRLSDLFQGPHFAAWNGLRNNEQSRFIGLTLPKILVRAPYELSQSAGVVFVETLDRAQDYLWGHACFAFASRLIDAFIHHGWFIEIHGQAALEWSGGVVNGLAKLHFATDAEERIARHTAELYLTDHMEKCLSQLGLIPVCQTFDSKLPIFFSSYSVQKQKLAQEALQANIKISSMLQYLLCACRFAHYVKMIGRDKIGSYFTPTQCQRYLNDWLRQFVATNEQLSLSLRASHPLRSAKVEIKTQAGMPGSYHCIIHIEPRFQLERIESVFVLTTELSGNTFATGVA